MPSGEQSTANQRRVGRLHNARSLDDPRKATNPLVRMASGRNRRGCRDVGVWDRHGVTTTDPCMNGWIEQSYTYVPGVMKMKANVRLAPSADEPNCPASAVTV